MMDLEVKKEIIQELDTARQAAELKAHQISYFLNSNDTYSQCVSSINKLIKTMAFKSYKNEDFSKEEQEHKKLLKQRKDILKKLNLKEEDLLPKYNCNICNDTGIVKGDYCDCFKKKYGLKLMQKSGISFEDVVCLKDFDLELFKGFETDVSKVLQIARQFVDNFETLKIKNLILTGGTGVGKTYLTKAIAKELLEKNISVYFTTAFALNQNFINEHYNNRFCETNGLQNLFDVDVLIIDDLGTQSMVKNVTVEYLLNLVNERLNRNKSTIISTNLTPQDMSMVYSDRLFSRLYDKRNFLSVNIVGKDLRIKNKK